MKTRVYKFIHTGSIGKALVLRDSLSTTVILWVLNAFSFLKPEFLMHSFGSEAWRPFCLQICTCRIDRVNWTRGTRIRHSVKNWMVRTEEWTFDTLMECYCLNYTYGPIKTWAHSYSGKARKNMFFTSRRPPHNTQVSQERFWSKNEKRFFMMWFWMMIRFWMMMWCTSGRPLEISSKSNEIIRIVIQNTVFMNIHAQARLLVKYELITPNSLREGAIQRSISPRCSFQRDLDQNTRYR